ncbi:MAG: SDR family NAD(P)-dependent oxidoreductase [Treponema sp.]|nr:SDR family NAD(P)-dependent oxidoreductase [Treponema sp.]
MNTIENNIIIITGASSGIGEETERLFVKNSAKVVLCSRQLVIY